MVCATFSEGRSVIHRLDPRVRIVVLAAFASVVAVSTRPAVAAAALGAALGLALLARLGWGLLLRRAAAVNGFMLVLVITLPMTVPGEPIATLGPVAFSEVGLRQAGEIMLKANAIVLAITALISSMHLVTFGHALGRLHVPPKLVHVLFFTVRYSDVLHHQYARLRRTMRVRGFRARLNRHTYRTFGYLVGMLLVRSFDRSHRILAAMKCRGFTGRFAAIDTPALAGRDAAFALAAALLLTALAALEFRWIL